MHDLKKQSEGSYVVKFTLTDSLGASNSYEFKIILKKIEIPIFRKFISPETEVQDIEFNKSKDKVIEENEEQKTPLSIIVDEFKSNGDLTLKFTEKLVQPQINVTELNQNKNAFFKLNYTIKGAEKIEPKIVSWNVTQLDQHEIKFKFNFSNKLYVSVGKTQDELSIQFYNTCLYVSEKYQ